MRGLLVSPRYIGVVIARHNGDFVRLAGLRQPFRYGFDFQGRCEIDEITGNRKMIRIALFDVFHQAVERPGKEMANPVPVPVDEAGDPLRGEFAEGEVRQWPQMDVGYMRKFEH